jgi:hypothetical protein
VSKHTDRRTLEAILIRIRTVTPAARAARLSTSDQALHGFRLDDVELTDDTLLSATDPALLEQLATATWTDLSDLAWDGVVGEDNHGIAVVPIPPTLPLAPGSAVERSTDGIDTWMQDLVAKTDWSLLRAQKRRLVDIQGRLADPELEAAPVERIGAETVDDYHTIEGLLNLLDALMDGAAGDLGDLVVFGADPELIDP